MSKRVAGGNVLQHDQPDQAYKYRDLFLKTSQLGTLSYLFYTVLLDVVLAQIDESLDHIFSCKTFMYS